MKCNTSQTRFDRAELESWMREMRSRDRAEYGAGEDGHPINIRAFQLADFFALLLPVLDAVATDDRIDCPACREYLYDGHTSDCPVKACVDAGLTRG